MSKGQEGGKHCNADKKHSQKTPDFSNKKPSLSCLQLFPFITQNITNLFHFNYLLRAKQAMFCVTFVW